MAVKIIKLGGVADWVDGDVLYAVDLKDTTLAANTFVLNGQYERYYAGGVGTVLAQWTNPFTYSIKVKAIKNYDTARACRWYSGAGVILVVNDIISSGETISLKILTGGGDGTIASAVLTLIPNI
jgi:hypothetical protein